MSNDDDGFFVVTRIHRDDLEHLGFDVSEVSDQTMKRLAEKISNDYLSQMYWSNMEIIMEIIAEDYFKIPKKLESPSATQTDAEKE